MEKKRNVNLDIIRIFALLSVISVHFFLNSEFYKVIIEEKRRFFLMVSIREFFMICVPLFIIITGYLNNKKKLEAKYYKSIIPRMILYFLISFVCLMFNIHYKNVEYTNIEIVNYIFHYGNNYSWYFNMYIGLFLLTPFLNIIYNNLETKKQKQILLLIMMSLTVLPSLFDEYYIILPTWWFNIYPIMYYFIGCYISEYEPKISKFKSLILIVLFIFGFGLIIYNKSLGNTYYKAYYNADWFGIMPFTLSILTFNFLNKLKSDKLPNWIKNILMKTSNLVFGAYLISIICDTLVYEYLNTNIVFKERIFYAPLCVLIVFISSLVLSYFANLITKLIMLIIKKLYVLFKYLKNKIKYPKIIF